MLVGLRSTSIMPAEKEILRSHRAQKIFFVLLFLAGWAFPVSALALPTTLEEILDQLERDPDNQKLRRKLNLITAVIFRDDQNRFREERRSFTSEERWRILRGTYRSMIDRIKNDAVRNLFMEGYDAFEKGHFLSAGDRFMLCRLLQPNEAWVREALKEYLMRKIPIEIEKRTRFYAAPIGETYMAAYQSLTKYDWEASWEALRKYYALKSQARLSIDNRKTLEDIDQLIGRVSVRVSQRISTGDHEGWIMHVLSTGERDPELMLPTLVRTLYQYPEEYQEPWWHRGAEGLRRAYFDLEIHQLITQAKKEHEDGKYKAATRLLVDILQKSPENPEAFALMDVMQEQMSRIPEIVAAAPERIRLSTETSTTLAKALPSLTQGRIKPREPSFKRRIQAEAFYKRGLQAYVLGDLKGAAAELKRALVLNPKFGKCDRALARIQKEMGGGLMAGAAP